MAKRKIDNSLYHFLLGAISNALPLEFAIRASELRYPEALARLKDIDKEIRECLLGWGARKEEIDAEELIDYAWDLLQIGAPRVRLHGRLIHPEIAEILNRCTSEIHSKINLKDDDLELPAAKYFRACDLLKGNDIRELLLASEECLRDAKSYGKNDDIEFNKFVRIRRVREPIRLHPSVEIAGDHTEAGERRLWLAVKIDSIFDALDIEQQIDEFLYQLALNREWNAPGDAVSSALFNKLLGKGVAGDMSEDGVARIDGIAAVLAGLYCRDLRKRNGLRLVDAKKETLEIYKASDDAVAKNYKQVNAKIKKYIEKFEAGVMVDSV
ncbi:hypothetical protein [Variovorax sp. EL159]|uniref:hypothetical protein n=1 Tax=Variovorax sp. EL159 TaxID=1566270 RepID=UPI00087FFFBD|nr:hypothetical protein [Variovorax sp. EL159]SCX72625.1 hypothetical protein SAMN03159363_4346 [Variovorax sp. EL159]